MSEGNREQDSAGIDLIAGFLAARYRRTKDFPLAQKILVARQRGGLSKMIQALAAEDPGLHADAWRLLKEESRYDARILALRRNLKDIQRALETHRDAKQGKDAKRTREALTAVWKVRREGSKLLSWKDAAIRAQDSLIARFRAEANRHTRMVSTEEAPAREAGEEYEAPAFTGTLPTRKAIWDRAALRLRAHLAGGFYGIRATLREPVFASLRRRDAAGKRFTRDGDRAALSEVLNDEEVGKFLPQLRPPSYETKLGMARLKGGH